jgi:hypothetical protein
MNKELSHYVRLFGDNKIGNLIFCLYLVCHRCLLLTCFGVFFTISKNDWAIRTEKYFLCT